ncbi:MAG: hypothetical protein VB137_09710 [Burkholderia sp.]
MTALQAFPDRLRAGFAIAFAGKKTTALGHQSNHVVQPWRVRRPSLVHQQVRTMDLVWVEEQCCLEIRAGSTEPHQIRNAPCHNHKQRQRTL